MVKYVLGGAKNNKMNKLIDILNEVVNESEKFEEFSTKRRDGAEKIANNAKEKGGISMLTYNHFIVKLPYYDKDILEALFEKDFNKAVQGAEELLKGYEIALVAKEVIIEMVFQLGKTGISKFKKMFDALKNNEYSKAADEMLNSAWYRQTPSRCEELSNLMRSCY